VEKRELVWAQNEIGTDCRSLVKSRRAHQKTNNQLKAKKVGRGRAAVGVRMRQTYLAQGAIEFA
jgi:hypothetical protein